MKKLSRTELCLTDHQLSGWKNINESDMILMPDPSTAVLDPFTAQPSLYYSVT